MLLPVQKEEIVGARFFTGGADRAAQFAAAVPFAFLHNAAYPGPNAAGMNVNVAFFRVCVPAARSFQPRVFYKSITRTRTRSAHHFAWLHCVCGGMLLVEACMHALPFAAAYLNAQGTQNLPHQLAALACGAALWAHHGCPHRRSVKRFQRLTCKTPMPEIRKRPGTRAAVLPFSCGGILHHYIHIRGDAFAGKPCAVQSGIAVEKITQAVGYDAAVFLLDSISISTNCEGLYRVYTSLLRRDACRGKELLHCFLVCPPLVSGVPSTPKACTASGIRTGRCVPCAGRRSGICW